MIDRASVGWRGFAMTLAGLRLLQDLRRALHDPPTQLPQRNSEIHTETAWRQPIPLSSHRIMVVSKRNIRGDFYTAPGTP
ncbi:MAG: hypothetical protein WCE29_27055, partial [Mycobacterium sp.]